MEEKEKTCATCTFFNRRIDDFGYCVNKNASIYVADTTADAPACRLHTPIEKNIDPRACRVPTDDDKPEPKEELWH